MAERSRITNAEDLPLVLHVRDFGQLLGRSDRTVERLHRAKKLPAPLIDGEHEAGPVRPVWARDAVIAWLAGGSPRRKRG